MAEKFFHDFAGLAMMPVAVLIMFSELWIMDKLIIPEPDPQPGEQERKPNSIDLASAK